MKRAWIIGNGPSLRETPLELLMGEVTFALNGIRHIYPHTNWRPSLYWMVDYSAFVPRSEWELNVDIHRKLGIPMWILDKLRDGDDEIGFGLGDLPNTTWVPRCPKHSPYSALNSKSMQEWHLPTICTALNHVSGMMQVLTLLGYDEICLVGCDLGYVADKTKNHFEPDYNNWDTRDMSIYQNVAATKAHEIAARCFPGKIYNCTIGGYLEVHERKSMGDVLAGR